MTELYDIDLYPFLLAFFFLHFPLLHMHAMASPAHRTSSPLFGTCLYLLCYFASRALIHRASCCLFFYFLFNFFSSLLFAFFGVFDYPGIRWSLQKEWLG